MKKFISEGLGDAFRNMPSLAHLQADVYRYMVAKNYNHLDKVDSDILDVKSINTDNGPQLFTTGPNKNRFQIPNRIIPDKTKLWIRIALDESETGPSKGLMFLQLGAHLSSYDGEIEPYKKEISMLDFINKWSNYNWSNFFTSAVSHIENEVTGGAKENKSTEDQQKDEEKSKSFDEFLEYVDLNETTFENACEGMIKDLKDLGVKTNEKSIVSATQKMYNSIGFDKFISKYDIKEGSNGDFVISPKFKQDLVKLLNN